MASTSAEQAFVPGDKVAWQIVGDGIRRQILAHTDDLMLVRVDFSAGAVGAMHHHPHRQISYVAGGRFLVTIGSESRELRSGDSFLALANVPHGVQALEDGTLLDSFTPARADFLPPVG